jgi:hypothetical protein
VHVVLPNMRVSADLIGAHYRYTVSKSASLIKAFFARVLDGCLLVRIRLDYNAINSADLDCLCKLLPTGWSFSQ